MNDTQKNSQDNLDRKLSILKDLMKKENEMLRKMISSLDSLEKEMISSQKKRMNKDKKASDSEKN
jgi:hypothetical protein